MRNYLLSVVSGLMCFSVSVPLQAGTDLTGEWVGSFKAVQVGRSATPQSPFAPKSREDSDDSPKFIEGSLTITFEVQQDGLAVGTWVSGQYGQRAACAMTGSDSWTCIDPGGHATIEVISASELKYCYLFHSDIGQGAACAALTKSN